MQNKKTARPPIRMDALKRASRYLWKYRGQAALPYVFLVVATLSQLAVPRLIRNIIDAVTRGAIATTVLDQIAQVPASLVSQFLPRLLEFLDYPRDWSIVQLTERLAADQASAPDALLWSGAAIVLFAFMRGLFAFLQTFWAERNSQGFAYEMRNDLYSKIQSLSFAYHDQQQTGQLMIRATDDVEKVRLFIGQGLLQLVSAVLLLGGTLAILFTTNASLALVTLPVLPISLVLFMFFGIVSQPLFARVQVRLSSLNTTLQENLAGIKVVQAFTREKTEQTKFNTAADALMSEQLKLARMFSFLFPLTFLIANMGQVATMYFGGRMIINGGLTIGQWQEFSLYLIYLFLPTAQFGFIITQLGQASVSAARVFEILDAESDVKDSPGAAQIPPMQGRVRFENVTFRYFESGEPVLQEVDFEIQPGQTLALLGSTGSGKTTIINLLPRFYDPSQGRILVDGYDLREVTLESLRSQIGIVLQETTLFSGTIGQNISFGRQDASQEDIEAAAKAAAAHDFIVSFPEGYDTPVGERGATLSGGQKQRIAIARALLLNPRILILDDSTSSVDMQTEAQIQAALDKLMHGRTSIVIAQRISTVMNADQILILDRGRVAARGVHEELLETSEIYAEIYHSQLVQDAGSALEESNP